MKLKLLFTIAFASQFIACASTHPGNEGVSLKSDSHLPLKISAQTIENAEGESFQLIEVTLENTSENWVKINRSRVVISNPAETQISVVLGQDLNDWAQAMQLRFQKDEHNKKLLQLGLVTAGAIAVAAGSKNNDANLAAAGSAAVLGTYAWAVTDVIRQAYKKVEQSEKVPDNHIYRPLSVPGKMFLRRWVLLNKPAHSLVGTLVLDLETLDGEKNTYAIKL